VRIPDRQHVGNVGSTVISNYHRFSSSFFSFDLKQSKNCHLAVWQNKDNCNLCFIFDVAVYRFASKLLCNSFIPLPIKPQFLVDGKASALAI
jgi:hypothetical protein